MMVSAADCVNVSMFYAFVIQSRNTNENRIFEARTIHSGHGGFNKTSGIGMIKS